MESDSTSHLVLSPQEDGSVVEFSSPTAGHKNIFLATFAAQLYIIALGMVSAYPSPACADMLRPGSRFSHISASEITWIASLPMLSGIVGNALSGFVSHRFGRKATLMYVSLFYASSWLIIAYAPTITFIYLGRILSGISAGMSAVAVSAYVVEISPVEIRGLLASSFQVAVSVGIFAMTGFGIFLRWSWLAISGAAVVVFGTCLLSLMPESPPWLIKMYKYNEAIEGIKFFKGKNYDAVKELEEIAKHIENEPKTNFSLSELRNPGLYKPLFIAIILMISMTFCGYSALVSYSVEVFQNLNCSVDPNLAATIVVTVQLIATVVSSILMDKAGRKVLYVISGSVMTLSLTIFGLYCYFSLKAKTPEIVNWTWVPLLSLLVYISAFSFGFGTVPFVVIPEIVPIASRSFVMSVACFTCSLSGFIVTKVYNDMKNSIGLYGTFWTYGLFSLFATIFYSIFIPETKGRRISDICKTFHVPVEV